MVCTCRFDEDGGWWWLVKCVKLGSVTMSMIVSAYSVRLSVGPPCLRSQALNELPVVYCITGSWAGAWE